MEEGLGALQEREPHKSGNDWADELAVAAKKEALERIESE